MALIIRDQLVSPPTWFLSFRDLTLYCKIFMRADIVIESDDPDPFWRWMKPRGGMDFVDQFVRTGTENGVRLDCQPRFAWTILTDRIAPENFGQLLRRIKGASGRL